MVKNKSKSKAPAKKSARAQKKTDKSKTPAQNSEQQKVLASWQAAAISYGALEFTDNLDRVGAKQSTLNRIEALRKAIVYVSANLIYPKLKDGQPKSKTIDFHDDLLTILENIIPYYTSVQRKAVPVETIKKLKELAKSLRRFAGEIILKTLTDEMRGLADDISHYSYPDILLIGCASVISLALEATASDFSDQETAKLELLRAGEMLNDFALRRFWPKDAKEKKSFKKCIIDDLKTYADKIDKLSKNRSKAGEQDGGTEVETGDSWQVPWDEANINYMQSSKARIQYTDNKMTAPTLSKNLGKISVHFMQKPGKGARVHIGEFIAWVEKRYCDPTAIFESESAQVYLSDIEARKAEVCSKNRCK